MTSDLLGIDLGTTFSAMAVVDQFGKPTVVPNAEGFPTTPSVIHFYERDACVVGDEAVKMAVVDPTNVVRFIKRSMGEADFTLEFFGRNYSPQELSAIILKKLRDDAAEALGSEIHDAVITVPAYFNSAQRGATAEAGRIAGFNVLSIINEPTTAAISYGIEKLGGSSKLLVFDLGGGTFDVTLMEIAGISFRTIASDGNAELGGKDWDDRLLNYVAEQFAEKFGLDPRDDPQPYQELYERCLNAKISLSSKPRAVIPVNFRGHRTVASITREEFEGMTRDLVEQCADTCNIVLERAGLGWQDLDEVLLVGGSTRMPMIRRELQALSNKAPAKGVNPDECVALGAALAGVLRHRPKHPALVAHRQALAKRARQTSAQPSASLAELLAQSAPLGDESNDPTALVGRRAGSEAQTMEVRGGAADNDLRGPGSLSSEVPVLGGLPPVRITDATTHPLGIVVLDKDLNERVVNLIPPSTPVPCEKRGRFAYAYDNMTAVRVEVTEGTGSSRDEVKVVGEVILENLPPRPRGTAIDVIYRYNVNQILEVDVIDVETKVTRRARMDLKGGLTKEGLREAMENVARAQVR
jgi:molecular chaperone DnaK (HSP70)